MSRQDLLNFREKRELSTGTRQLVFIHKWYISPGIKADKNIQTEGILQYFEELNFLSNATDWVKDAVYR